MAASRMRRIGIVAAIVVAAALAFVLVAPRFVDADRFRPQAEAALEEMSGREVELGPLRLEIGFGVRVATASLAVGPPLDPQAPPGPTASAADVRLRLAVLPLLAGRVALRGVELSNGTVAQDGGIAASGLDLDADLDPSGDGTIRWHGRLRGRLDALGGAGLDARFRATSTGEAIAIDRIDADVGRGTVGGSGRIDGLGSGEVALDLALDGRFGATEARGTFRADVREQGTRVDFEIDASMLDLDEIAAMAAEADTASGAEVSGRRRSLSPFPEICADDRRRGAATDASIVAAGVVRAVRGRFAGMEFEAFESSFDYREGAASFEDARFRVYGGSQSGRFRIRLDDAAFPFEVGSSVRDVDLGPLIGAFRPDLAEAVEGSGALDLSLVGRAGADGPEDTVRGDVALRVEDGRLSGVSLLDQIARALASASGREATTGFRSLTATFEVRDRIGRTRDLALRSPDLDLDGRGTVAFDGALDLDVEARLSPEATAGILDDVPELDVRVGDDRRLSVPMRIRGNVAAPEVEIDVRRVLEEGLGRKLRDKLEGLFRR